MEICNLEGSWEKEEGSLDIDNKNSKNVVTCLHKAKRRKYITEDVFQNNYKAAFDLMNMIIAYRKKLQS